LARGYDPCLTCQQTFSAHRGTMLAERD